MCSRRCGWRLWRILENRHRIALAINHILDGGVYCFGSRQLAGASSTRPSLAVRGFKSLAIQRTAGIALEVRDCAVRIAKTSYYDMYMSCSNMGSYELPTPVLTDSADSIQHNS